MQEVFGYALIVAGIIVMIVERYYPFKIEVVLAFGKYFSALAAGMVVLGIYLLKSAGVSIG